MDILAGENVDLGVGEGIVTTGSQFNANLQSSIGADLSVMVGMKAGWDAENFIDKTKGLLYKRPNSTVGNRHKEGGTAMRRLVTLMLALGLLLGIAGSALAECGGSHTDTATPTTQKPLPQS